ncbi:protein C12orf4 homolog isoform X2 [Agrilus planipennis]|uniref:Protein C12orf4 homolog isoform X2 n=1 Tax=Agrilus planipennis TaxID=224129 RepID=A0A7F5RG03_AGRPL|nr:protein C12orf4 homolog isoform X2 [Agrilus planipennis]
METTIAQNICLNLPLGFTEVEVNVSNDTNIEELIYILINDNKVPVYLEKECYKEIEKHLRDHVDNNYNLVTDKIIQDAKSNTIDVEEIIKEWEKMIREETAEFGEKVCASDEELFALAYHKLVHSPALETMLQLEHTYAQTIRHRVDERDRQIKSLSDIQTDEMTKAVDRLEDEDMNERKINEIAARHFEDHSFLRVQLTSELETLKEAQRREYREWIMQILEQNQAKGSLPTPNSPLSPSLSTVMSFREPCGFDNDLQNLYLNEESFTIHLGSQLKQMHNIRVLTADVIDLCSINETCLEPTPQLLQTSLALYSNDLSGLVLLTDPVVGTWFTTGFSSICQRSTEFHFPHIEDQYEAINNVIKNHLKDGNSKLLQPGDFYITRHSNLPEVHVVFHMVTDDRLKSADINSRNAVILGLRSILKVACSYDITSLTIPLLLQYEMTEEMTVAWCTKRAELVFKCVKGFMIEMASWGGSDLKNLQFLLPRGLSHEVFQSLTAMLPSIFKVSNPLILKST